MKCTISMASPAARRRGGIGRARHDLPVAFHRHLARIKLQQGEQVGDARPGGDMARLAIHLQGDRFGGRCGGVSLMLGRWPGGGGRASAAAAWPACVPCRPSAPMLGGHPARRPGATRPTQGTAVSLPLIAVLNGPNLNLLGLREPGIYGTATLDDIEALCAETAEELNLAIDFRADEFRGRADRLGAGMPRARRRHRHQPGRIHPHLGER